jgi:hypothetical protein
MQRTERILWIKSDAYGGEWIRATASPYRTAIDRERKEREASGCETMTLPKGVHPDDPGALDAATSLALPGTH